MGDSPIADVIRLLFRQARLRSSLKRDTRQDITVVLAVKDVVEGLENCFRSIRAQSYDPALIDIILVDYGSKRSAPYERLCRQHNARLLKAKAGAWSRSHALNIGLRRVRTKFVLISDADILFAPNYIESCMALLRKDPFQVLVNRMLDLPPLKPNQLRLDRFAQLKERAKPRLNLKTHISIHATATLFHQLIHGYDETYKLWGYEDNDLAKRFKMLGLPMNSAEDHSSYLHQHHAKFRGVKGPGLQAQIDANQDHFVQTKSIIRNPAGWGEAEVVERRTHGALARLLRTHRGKAFLLLNSGNKGDGLILEGTRKLLKEHGVKVTELTPPTTPTMSQSSTLFIQGSGAFCRSYHNRMPDVVRRYAPSFKDVILLPSSFEMASPVVRELLETLPANVTIFCRERTSYMQLKPFLPAGRLFLDHDLAFDADYSRWQRKGGRNGRDRADDAGTLHAFRTDHESIGRRLPADNRDVSLNDKGTDRRPLEERWREMLDAIAGYAEVHTDRAHVAIAAAMLGKQTVVYPDNYHKVRGIYDYSLAGLPNVRWAGAKRQ